MTRFLSGLHFGEEVQTNRHHPTVLKDLGCILYPRVSVTELAQVELADQAGTPHTQKAHCFLGVLDHRRALGRIRRHEPFVRVREIDVTCPAPDDFAAKLRLG